MFGRKEAQQYRKEFWTAFGRFMTRNRNDFGMKMNWLNYKTGLRHVYLRSHADNKKARVSIELQHPDAGIRELFYEQFLEAQNLLHNLTGNEWTWQPEWHNEHGQEISRIFIEKEPLNLYEKSDWTDFFEFFEYT